MPGARVKLLGIGYWSALWVWPILITCSRHEPPPAAPTPTFSSRAEELITKFQTQLRSELLAAIQDGGPAKAVEICSERAPKIQQALTTDLKIRRIGTRARNPKNRPSDAEREILQKLSRATPTFEDPQGPTYYKAIFVDPLCLNCHGSEQIPPPVREILRTRYPDDEATGYQEGELRGAFVVQR